MRYNLLVVLVAVLEILLEVTTLEDTRSGPTSVVEMVLGEGDEVPSMLDNDVETAEELVLGFAEVTLRFS